MTTMWHYVFWISLGLLVYMLLGYPLILLVVRRLRRRRSVPAEPEELPTVTCIIPAHNEERVLQAKLENALALDYPRDRLEIVVASDGSADRTVEIAQSFAPRGVRVLEFSARRGKASVLNDACAEATGQVLCLCDANVMFQRDALQHLVRPLDDTQVGAVTGVVLLASEESNFGEGESFYYLLERAVQLAESDVGSLMGVDGGMYVIRRELFQALPAETILDDFAISMQAVRNGQRVVYQPLARATESGTPTATQEFRRRLRMAAGTVQILKWGYFPRLRQPVLLWQFLSHKLVRWVGPWLLLTLLLANIALWSAGPFFQGLLVAQLAVYATALVAAVYVPLRGTRVTGVVFYFVMSQFAMALGVIRGLLNLQKVTWVQAERLSDGSAEPRPTEQISP
ncbi:MAG: glycosyltransferase family 2 protein [Planctomycetota bacterium]|nr:glycosyltransferase family 2 protein [Planctomycetota bacterium]